MRLRLAVVIVACAACAEDPIRPTAVASDAGGDAGGDAPAPDAADASIDVAPTGDTVEASVDVAPDVDRRMLRVLFVGNSYTYVNDLPGLLTRMAAAGSRVSEGPIIVTESVTVGGATLRDHWTTGTAASRIGMGPWAAVVLQGQSVEPVLNYADFRTHAVRFGTLVSTANARAVFYATWPRREGDAVYEQSWSGGTPTVFNSRLDLAYSQVAAMVDGDVAHVGNAWMRSLRDNPSIQLYDSDGSHPSPAGTFLAACVLYRAIAARPVPDVVDGVAGVSPDDARRLRASAASP